MKKRILLSALFVSATTLLATVPDPISVTEALKIYPPPALSPLEGVATCLECEGKGVVRSRLQKLDKRKSMRSEYRQKDQNKLAETPILMVKCPNCKGEKRGMRRLTLQERINFYLRIRNQYEAEQTALRRIPFGAAYVDEAFLQLDPETFATHAARFPAKCEKCYGFGELPCARCDSVGMVTKLEKDTDGFEEKEVKVVCASCSGVGVRPCKTCDRSGLQKSCRRCKGTGVQRKPATKKRSMTVERCASCDGTCRR